MPTLPFARMSELNDEPEPKMEMIERVARAIALAALDDETRAAVDPETWPVAESYCDMARAAIEALSKSDIEELRREHGDGI